MYFTDCLWPLLIQLIPGCGGDKSPVSMFEESQWKVMPGILLLIQKGIKSSLDQPRIII